MSFDLLRSYCSYRKVYVPLVYHVFLLWKSSLLKLFLSLWLKCNKWWQKEMAFEENMTDIKDRYKNDSILCHLLHLMKDLRRTVKVSNLGSCELLFISPYCFRQFSVLMLASFFSLKNEIILDFFFHNVLLFRFNEGINFYRMETNLETLVGKFYSRFWSIYQ